MFSAISAAAGLVAHGVVRHYWVAVVIGATGASIVNIVHEASKIGVAVRPVDLFFWIPMLLVMGIAGAFPVAAIAGIPFHLIRRRKRKVS